MKNSIQISSVLNIKITKNFENNIKKTLPEGVNKIYLNSCGMKKLSGYGSYHYFLDIEINNQKITLTEHTHDSQSFDYWQDLELGTRKFENFIKNVVLSLLELREEEIIELIDSIDLFEHHKN